MNRGYTLTNEIIFTSKTKAQQVILQETKLNDPKFKKRGIRMGN